jgi:uncharacterized protein YxeA
MKTKILFIITLLAIIILNFSSCKKGVEDIRTKVYGRITDYYSGQPITNAAVKIFTIDSRFEPFRYDTTNATLTDDNGEYEITFHGRREDYINYGISISKQPEGYKINDFGGIKKKHSNQLDFSMRGNAYLKVHIKNVTPFDNNDKIDLDAIIFFASGVGNYVGHGIKIDTSVLFSTQGEGNLYMKLDWFIIKNSITKEYLDSIYCTSMDTANYTLNY